MMEIGPVRRQSLIGFFTTIGVTFIGFFATVYIAHAAGPDALGAYFLLVTYLPVLLLFTDLGSGGAAVQLENQEGGGMGYYSAHLAVRVILTLTVTAALLMLRPLFADLDSAGLFWWLVAALIAGSAAGAVATGMYGKGKTGIIQIADLIGGLVRIAVQIAAVYLGYAAAGLAGGFVAGLVAAFAFNSRFLGTGFVRFGKKEIRRIVAIAPWIWATAVAGTILGVADTVLLGYFSDLADVGLYRTAFQLASLATFTMIAVRTAIYPQIARWHATGDICLIESSVSRALTYSLIFAVPACTGGWILADRLLYYLYGADFIRAAPALAILLASQLAAIASGIGITCLFAVNRQREAFCATVAGSCASVITGIILIPVLGIAGAAVACLTANLVTCLFALRRLSGSVRIGLERQSVSAIAASSAAMGGFILVLRFVLPVTNIFHLIVLVGAGIFIYAVILLRVDPAIRGELRDLSGTLGIPWPGWL